MHEEAADATKQQEEQQLAAQISKATVPRLQLDTMVNEADNVPALTPSDSPVVSQRTARSSQRGEEAGACLFRRVIVIKHLTLD